MRVGDELPVMAAHVLSEFRNAGHRIATAESCTGGLISALLTSVAGSSDVFDRGFVTYSNDAKQEMLDVSAETLAEHGAVSAQTAGEMVTGALENSRADAAVAVTGIAGPGGGTEEKPTGTVFIAVAEKSAPGVYVEQFVFDNTDRDGVRARSAEMAFEMLLAYGTGGESH